MDHPLNQPNRRRARRSLSSHGVIATLLALAVSPGCGQQSGPGPSEKSRNSTLPLYELKMDPKDLRLMERNAFSDNTQPATLIIGGGDYGYVRVRFRGEWARSWPKKPLKIFFSRDKPFQGHRSVNLNSAWRDPAFVRETLAYHIYATCGAPASLARMVRVNINGQFRGLYVEVEQVDDAWLRRFNLNGTALFKATSDNNQADERDLGSEASFAAHYANEIDKDEGLGELRQFCHELARATNTLDFFTRRVDLEKYINYLAATVLVQHWDGFNKNHYLVHDRQGSGKWLVVPWDLDRTLGDHWGGGFESANLSILLGTRRLPAVTGWNRIQDRFLSDPSLRARFLDRLAELLEKEFTPAKLFPILDQLESDLGPDAALDRRRWGGPNDDLQSGIAGVKSFIQQRRAFLLAEVKKLR
jgi:spore coat protein H